MTSGPRVFDCFTFSTELDLLAFRLDLLAPVVDQFVLVEAPRTFSGLNKPLYFEENRHRFKRHLDRITHIVVDDLPLPEPDRWVPEHFQRNAILRGLQDAAPDDIALVTDVDEIPDPEVVQRLRGERFETAALEMRVSYYYANWESSDVQSLGGVSRVGSLSSPHDLRPSSPLLRITNAGCHLAYLMSPGDIARKYTWFAHEELDQPTTRASNYLESMMALGLVAHTGEMLSVRSPEQLGPVQQAFLASEPGHFRFTPPPPVLRRIGQGWRRVRFRPPSPSEGPRRFDVSPQGGRTGSRLMLPVNVIRGGDTVLARLSHFDRHAQR